MEIKLPFELEQEVWVVRCFESGKCCTCNNEGQVELPGEHGKERFKCPKCKAQFIHSRQWKVVGSTKITGLQAILKLGKTTHRDVHREDELELVAIFFDMSTLEDFPSYPLMENDCFSSPKEAQEQCDRMNMEYGV